MNRPIDRRTLLGSSAALAATFAAPRSLLAQPDPAGPPAAPIRPVIEELFGVKVTDPYRWMEAEPQEWKDWTLAQAAYARGVLDRIPGRDALVQAVSHYTGAIAAVSAVQVGGDFIFTQVRPANADTFKLFVRKGVHGQDRMLLDPDSYAEKGSHAALDWWAASPDGSHVVFGTSPGGSEKSTARVIVTETGQILPEAIDRTEDASPSWAADGSGFYYNRLQAGVGDDSIDKFKDSACWFHRLSTDPATDAKVLWKGSSPVVAMTDVDFPIVFATPGSPLVGGAVISGVQNEIGLQVSDAAAAQAGRPAWRQVCTPADKVTNFALQGDQIFLLSHAGASNYQVLRATAADPSAAHARIAVPQSAAVIRGFGAARDGLYLQELNAGIGGLRRMSWDGRITTIRLPFAGSIDALTTDSQHDGAWFLLQGWVRPTVLCYVGPDGAVIETDIAPQPPIDISLYTSEELLAPARDGTRVPLSVIYKKGLKRDGSAPLLLWAYGSYGITEDPSFISRWLPLLDLGGVFALAHVRGGGELGEDWHVAGQKLTKANTWRDDIDCAEFLIRQRFTSPNKLAIMGGSAGGITVGRFMTDRPDLAAVVFNLVGASNPLRGEFQPNGPPNIPEFGSVTTQEGFKALWEMDAYQHVRDGMKYPSTMVTTGLNDPRVSSWEPTKMAARLQAANASRNPILLRVETDAGHGIGSTRGQRDRETGDELAFMLWRTGDPHYQPR